MGKKKPETETVRIPKTLAKKIRIVSAFMDVSVPDFIAQFFEPTVDRELARAMKKGPPPTAEE